METKQTKKHVYQSLINNNFTYRITRFFHGKLFSCFAIYPSRGSYFCRRKICVYVVNKELTVADEVLFSARLSGAQAAAETSIRVLNTQCVDVAQKYCFPFHP